MSERLPAFAARPVVAALDRSTIVFAGSRPRGEARLRARAALLAGDKDGFALARDAGLRPTHAVFDPASQQQPSCGSVLYRDGIYALCELVGDGIDDGLSEVLEVSTQPAIQTVAEADCGEIALAARRNPWTAAVPIATCRIGIPEKWRRRDGLHLVVELETGRAADELRIAVTAAGNATKQWRATVRTKNGAPITLPLPPFDTDEIEVHVASSFLPVVRLRRVSLATR